MNTQDKGDLAVAKAIVKFTEMGWYVLLPTTESAPYDLVVDTNEGLKKVQVKYCGGKNAAKPYLRLRKIHSNSTGYIVKGYELGDFDWAYVYCDTGDEYLIKNIPINIKTQYTLLQSDKI